MDRNGWPPCFGMGGHFGSESVATMRRNMHLELLDEKQKKLEKKIEETKDSKAEWIATTQGEKFTNPEGAIKNWLVQDFRSTVSLMKRGGDPDWNARFGYFEYGIRYKHRNEREVIVPREVQDSGQRYFASESRWIWEQRDNQEAYEEWMKYMEKGLLISDDWDYDRTLKEIEKFFANAPNLERYSQPYWVFKDSGIRYDEPKLKVG